MRVLKEEKNLEEGFGPCWRRCGCSLLDGKEIHQAELPEPERLVGEHIKEAGTLKIWLSSVPAQEGPWETTLCAVSRSAWGVRVLAAGSQQRDTMSGVCNAHVITYRRTVVKWSLRLDWTVSVPRVCPLSALTWAEDHWMFHIHATSSHAAGARNKKEAPFLGNVHSASSTDKAYYQSKEKCLEGQAPILQSKQQSLEELRVNLITGTLSIQVSS